jgi:nucleotide-binding universal stress UspA family protein
MAAARCAAAEDEMFCPSRILVPVDFTNSALPAAACAYDLARLFGGRVHLLHVVTEPTPQGWATLVPNVDLDLQAEEWRIDAVDELAAFATRVTQAGMGIGRRNTSLAVRSSADPAEAILDYARNAGCDLIVMGTHRRSPLGSLLHGSTAEWVRRRAACPVLLVPPAVDAAPEQPRLTARTQRETAAAPSA